MKRKLLSLLLAAALGLTLAACGGEGMSKEEMLEAAKPCNFGAIRFGCRPSGPGSSESIPAAEETNGKKSESTPEIVDTSRRGFLLTAGAGDRRACLSNASAWRKQ